MRENEDEAKISYKVSIARPLLHYILIVTSTLAAIVIFAIMTILPIKNLFSPILIVLLSILASFIFLWWSFNLSLDFYVNDIKAMFGKLNE
jgi:hypothetical protein